MALNVGFGELFDKVWRSAKQKEEGVYRTEACIKIIRYTVEFSTDATLVMITHHNPKCKLQVISVQNEPDSTELNYHSKVVHCSHMITHK
jgi:hypothetical protein